LHGRFDAMHDDTMLDYSLVGAFARLVALGMPFEKALAAVTVNPARVLREDAEIGTLAVGSRADVTVLEEHVEKWPLCDSQGEALIADRRWVPHLVVRAGEPIVPTLRLLRDVLPPPQRAAA
jgi:dihydroorotase